MASLELNPALDSTTPDAPADSRPVLVMLCNAQTPYRLAFHLRIARELKQYRLVSIFTHDESNSPWVIQSPPEIGPVFFGHGQTAVLRFHHALFEYFKGGRVIEYLKSIRPAAVVVHGYNDGGRLRIIRWCAANRTPVFLWADSNVRSDTSRGLKRLIKSVYVRHVVSKVNAVLVCGRLGRQFFEQFVRPEKLKTFLVPYEPDYRQIQEFPAREITRVAADLGLDPNRRRIVYSGRLAPEKRVDLLLKAFARIADSRPNWDLVVVGDGPLRKELQSLVPDALEPRIRWLGFQKDQKQVTAIYHNCDLLCLPSQYEPWALVVSEAAAAGLAIVTSDVVGASAELVREGVNGKTFPNKNLDALVEALLSVTQDDRIDRFKAASLKSLSDWRTSGDPIRGLVEALSDC